MSITPIWDATLADAPRNIWEASSIFPRPAGASETLQEALTRIGHPQFRSFEPQWAATDPRYHAKVTGHFPDLPPLQPAFTDWTAIYPHPRNVA